MYTPLNQTIFEAAFSGALAGMGISGRVLTSNNPADYTGLATVAGAFAQAVDTAWGSAPAANNEVTSVSEGCEAAWEGRSPLAVSPNTLASNYTTEAAAIVTAARSDVAYFASQGIIPATSPAAVPGTVITQSDFEINSVTGNDANSGLPGSPLRTLAGLSQRLGYGTVLAGALVALPVPHQQITVTLDNDAADPLTLFDLNLPPNTLLLIKGTPVAIPNPGGTGAFTAVTALARTTALTQTPWTVTDAGINWATLVGKRLRITAGANAGMLLYVVRDLGAGVAQVSAPARAARDANLFLFSNVTLGIVSVGDPYVIEQMTAMPVNRASVFDTSETSTMAFQDVDFRVAVAGAFTVQLAQGAIFGQYSGCTFTAGATESTGNASLNQLLACGVSGQLQSTNSLLTAQAGYSVGVQAQLSGIAQLDFDFSSVGGTGVRSQGIGAVLTGTCGVYFSSGGPGAGVVVGATSSSAGAGFSSRTLSAGTHQLYGNGNSSTGMLTNGGSCFRYQTNIPTVTGATSDFVCGQAGLLTARAFDETAGAYTAPIATAPSGTGWANMAAATPGGFGGGAHNLTRDSHIARTN